MRLKKNISELVNRQTDRIIYSRILKRTTSIVNIFKTRGLEIIYISGLFLFSAGIVNGLLEGPRLPEGYVIFPQRGIQTASESIVYMFIMGLGTLGMYLVYMGARDTSKKRISNFYMIFGFSSMVIAIFFIFYIFFIKV